MTVSGFYIDKKINFIYSSSDKKRPTGGERSAEMKQVLTSKRRYDAANIALFLSIASVVMCGLSAVCESSYQRTTKQAECDAFGVALMLSELKEVQVRDLKEGEGGWVVPWAIKVSETGSCWLDTHATVCAGKAGTASVRVFNRPDIGFVARDEGGDYRWSASPIEDVTKYRPVRTFTY